MCTLARQLLVSREGFESRSVAERLARPRGGAATEVSDGEPRVVAESPLVDNVTERVTESLLCYRFSVAPVVKRI